MDSATLAFGAASLLAILWRRRGITRSGADEGGEDAARANGKRSKVCVTGGSGFLGAWCVKKALDAGFDVNVTTRSAKKAAFLQALAAQSGGGSITVFEGCDLLEPGSFDKAIEGCVGVLHTASPFYIKGGSEEKLVKPAVEGTANVLDSCSRQGVRKVVLTSSTAAVYVDYGSKSPKHIYTSDDWSDPQVLRKKSNWYALSKTLAEKKAWELAGADGCPFKLAVINPTLIWGPLVDGQPHLNTSSNSLVGMMDGSKTEYDNAAKAIVDVRDTAEAHVAPLLQDESWPGWGKRYLCLSDCPHWKEVADCLSAAGVDESKIPQKMSAKLGKAVMGPPPPNKVRFDSSPCQKLLSRKVWITTRQMVEDSVKSLHANGFRSQGQYAPEKM